MFQIVVKMQLSSLSSVIDHWSASCAVSHLACGWTHLVLDKLSASTPDTHSECSMRGC